VKKHANTGCYIGLAYLEIGNIDAAFKYLQHIEKIVKGDGDNSTVALYVMGAEGLSSIYRQRNDPAHGEAVLNQAIEKYLDKNAYMNSRLTQDAWYSELMFHKGLTLVDQKKYPDAEAAFKKVIQNRIRKSLVAKAQLQLANIYSIVGRTDEAYSTYQESIESVLNSLKSDLYAFSEKERTGLIKEMPQAITGFNYFAYQNIDKVAGIKGTLYNYQLQVKSILFNSSRNVSDRILSSGDNELIDDFQRLKAERLFLSKAYAFSADELKRSNIDIKVLEARVNEHEKDLAQRSLKFSSIMEDNELPTWQNIQKALGNSEAAVELIRIQGPSGKKDVKYLAIIAPHSGELTTVTFEDGYALVNQYLSYYQNAIKSKITDEHSFGRFWSPLAPAVRSFKKIHLSPDGIFSVINIGGLYDPNDKRYVMDQTEINIITSTRDLVKPDRSSGGRNVVLVGAPQFKLGKSNSTQLAATATNKDSIRSFFGGVITDLPGTASEIMAINTQLKGNKIPTVVLDGAEANEENVKTIAGIHVIHFATHGFFYSDNDGALVNYKVETLDRNPLLRSGLLLAGAQNTLDGTPPGSEDGILTAQEALNLNLDDAELVVLSACETGKGKIQNGEGIYGLQRAFQMAGARSVIVSLWKVDDEATSRLMSLFYENWIVGKMAKREAFLSAQKKVRDEYPEPYYWAAFVIVGG
jgi:CHAT domain-containing protein/tetratricopeptide (TPR) repeat protein